MHLSPYIDHTILKPATTLKEIEKVCNEAVQHQFAAVCIPPYFVKEAARYTAGSPVNVATVIGFPFGYQHHSAKLAEAQQAIKDGAHELDMVMNIAAFKHKDFTCLAHETRELLHLTQPQQIIVKIIIESGILSEEEIIQCCLIYQNFNIDFLKTSTGYAEKGATVEAVQLMRQHLPERIKIKASGGIKTYAFAKNLIDAGAQRLGCSASLAIIAGESGADQGY